MIDIKGITKSFGSLQVLKGIDLHINKGEVVASLAPVAQARPPCYRLLAHSTDLMREA